jgi:hypothetical protein
MKKKTIKMKRKNTFVIRSKEENEVIWHVSTPTIEEEKKDGMCQ